MTHTDVFCEPHFPIREEEYVDLQHPRLPVTISAVLGHADPESANTYMSVDEQCLVECVLPLPQGVRS